MSRISEASNYILFSLEAALIDIDHRGQPVSVKSIIDILKDAREVRLGILPVQEINGACSADVIAMRVKARPARLRS